ncbi:hypothetical protein LIL_13062 [Leptospira interrogans serovar Linhai str. 56609]|nr:hypothetical protein LIL_13062 [Leptospira interrogans serovar Linhai str. 56609]
MTINKTASIAGFHKIETDGELIFQQFYSTKFFYYRGL